MNRRRTGLWVLAITALICVGEASVSEYQVKAAFIFKFANYIRWPERSGSNEQTPFIIGVLGKDPFGRELDVVVKDQSVHGRTIVVRRLTQPQHALVCDVLFISSSERGALKEILAAVRGAPVLTIGDMDQFAELGGMINLVTSEDRHIRFDINKGAVDRAGLKAGSQLLGLARVVVDETGG
ncbi:MAG: YfiR family protein, partial [Thermoanaerobaculia bacterium]